MRRSAAAASDGSTWAASRWSLSTAPGRGGSGRGAPPVACGRSSGGIVNAGIPGRSSSIDA